MENPDSVYTYATWRRDVYVWVLLIFLLLSAWSIAVALEGEWDFGRVAFAALYLALASYFGLRYHILRRRDFRSVRISHTGVSQEVRDDGVVSIAWNEIDRVDPLDLRERLWYGDVAGMKIVAGEREIRIFRSIRNWKEIRETVERETRMRDIPMDAPA